MRPTLSTASIRAGLILLAVLLTACAEKGENTVSEARDLILAGRFKAAHEILQHLEKTRSAGFSDNPELAYLYALSSWHRIPASDNSITEAENGFNALVQNFPDSGYASLARYNLARIAEIPDFQGDEPRLDEARAIYDTVIATSTDARLVDEAILMKAGSYIEEFDNPASVQTAVDIVEEMLRSRPQSLLRRQAHLYLGDIYFDILGAPADALANYLAADQYDISDDTLKAMLYWRIAWVAEHETGDIATAVKYYQKLCSVPASRTYEAIQQLVAIQKRYPNLEIQIPSLN